MVDELIRVEGGALLPNAHELHVDDLLLAEIIVDEANDDAKRVDKHIGVRLVVESDRNDVAEEAVVDELLFYGWSDEDEGVEEEGDLRANLGVLEVIVQDISNYI